MTTSSDNPPQLNWIYVDKDTYGLKYGFKLNAEPHPVGPWNCTQSRRGRPTFDAWEDFTVVEVRYNTMRLYFDVVNYYLLSVISSFGG